MQKALCFDDVLIIPSFSEVESRKDVSVVVPFQDGYRLPIISSNMDTITEAKMCRAMIDNNAMAALHRFCDIDNNIKMFVNGRDGRNPMVSVGIGEMELERAEALRDVGASTFIIDVAHGASIATVNQVKKLQTILNCADIIVGNFATGKDIDAFEYHLGKKCYAYKVGIGGGSACTTRVVTGCGLPTLASIISCKKPGRKIIADGGIRNSGDVAKALAAGADVVMLGQMLAGTDETPGSVQVEGELGSNNNFILKGEFKKYRGSASLESYQVQNKESVWRTPEGESFFVPYKGPVKNVIQQIEAGLRSALSYVGASSIDYFKQYAEFVEVSSGGAIESKPHGKCS